jgi:fucose permease
VPLATTELGVDSWMSQLLGPAMEKAGFKGIHILIYTAALMMVLRFFAGALLHRLSPVGVLAACSGVAATGLFALAGASSVAAIFACATIYAVGKTFFWPTMLGVVAEQFPKGGALTLNATGGVGMLGVGVLGAMLMGNVQDRAMDRTLRQQAPAIHAQVMVERQGLLGTYQAVDEQRLKTLPDERQAVVAGVGEQAKRSALRAIVALPLLMLAFYLGLILWFRSRGGYRPVTAG